MRLIKKSDRPAVIQYDAGTVLTDDFSTFLVVIDGRGRYRLVDLENSTVSNGYDDSKVLYAETDGETKRLIHAVIKEVDEDDE